MNISFNRDKMFQAFQMVNMVIPARSAMPVLQNVKISTDDKTVSVIATDLEVGIQAYVKADIKEKGALLVPAVRLGAILRETTDDKMEIKSDNGVAGIISKGSQYKIMAPDTGDYPDFPVFNPKKAIEISSKGLREMVHKTIFAVSMESSRYALTGLLLEIKKKEIRLVASDGKRLAYIKRHSEQNITSDYKIIVPPKILAILERILSGSLTDDDRTTEKESPKKPTEELMLKLDIDEHQLKISIPQKDVPDTVLFCRLIEGVFPDYDSIIPADNDKKIEVNSGTLASAFRRVALVTTDKLRATKLDFKENKITLISRTQDVGEATVTMDIKYSQAAFAITFNPDYFLDMLRVIGDTNIVMELKNKTSPAVVKYGKDYIYLIMPMTVEI